MFRGVYRMLDIEAEKQKLRENMSLCRRPVEPDFVEDMCELYRVCGVCNGYIYRSCPENNFPTGYPFDDYIPPCPGWEHHDDEKRLAELEMEPLQTLLFQNPKMAVHNELFNANLVYYSG